MVECNQSDRHQPEYFEKQGYSHEVAAERLDPDIRQLLDGVLRLYREPGLFLDRKEALKVIVAQVNERHWDQSKAFPGKKRLGFKEDFVKRGIFARPGWTGFYSFGGQPAVLSSKWYSKIDIRMDAATVCIESRAIEGYLDLMLDSNLFDILPGHAPRGRIFRHEVPYARPWAVSLSGNTPSILLNFSRGCLVGLIIAGGFSIGEVDHEKAFY